MEPPRPGRLHSNVQGLGLNCLDIIVLTGFAVAQPLFAMLGRSAEFFVVHRSKGPDLLVLVACAYVVPAGILILVELLTAAVWRKAIRAVHLAVLAALLTAELLPAVKRTALPGMISLAMAVALGVTLAIGYLRVRTWRWSLVYLSPALLVFPILLLFFSPASALLLPSHAPGAVAARVGNPAPIVFVVFDEFPVASLMDKDDQIDANLYPNFAELASQATWYRNATSVAESTLLSLPTILSGKWPDLENPQLPDAEGHPDNLFTLLGGFYRLNVTENNTRLCPERLCSDETPPARQRIPELLQDSVVLWMYAVLPADLTGSLPDITQSWKDFRSQPAERAKFAMWKQFDELTDWHDRVQRFRDFVDSIRASDWPTLHFLHILLPHAPWEYLPSGQKGVFPESRVRGLRGINDRGEDPSLWTDDSWAVTQSYQRHLLQVGLVDRLVGSLVKRLRDLGLYDPALVVITADHGTSFRPGESRRRVTPTNYSDILSVPLLIKYPHQQHGGVDDRSAETTDILPTILDVLQVDAGWQLDGRSLLDDAAAPRPATVVFTDAERRIEFPAGLDALFRSVQRKIGLFGGAAGYDLYHAGDRYGWSGREVPAATPDETGIRCQLDHEAYYTSVDPNASELVTDITGQLLRSQAGDLAHPLTLAIAVNGAVRAVTQTYREGDEERFSALVPRSALRAGRNEVAVFRVRSGTGLGRIRRVGLPPYDWGTVLTFAANGSALPYYGVGWSTPEAKITWTDGHVATLDLPTHPPRADVRLIAHLGAFTAAGKLDRQRLRVLVNGHQVAEWAGTAEFQDHTANIPKEYIGDAGTEIMFELPDAVVPAELGASSDLRTLGIAITQIELRVEEVPR